MGQQEIIAFGVEPSQAKYRLRLARYPSLVESLKGFLNAFNNRQSITDNQQYNVLDVGVGNGRTFKYAQASGIADRFSWYGVDLYRFPPESRAGGEKWSIEIANIEYGLPYPDGYFDIVIAEQILEHVHNVDFVISELSRVTKQGGRLIIGVPIFICPVAALRNLYVKKFPRLFEKSGSSHIQTFCKKSITERLESNGSFKVMDTKGFRIISGGILRPLENYLWWYRLSCWAGKLFPFLCIEIQMVVEKRLITSGCTATAFPPLRSSKPAREPQRSMPAGFGSYSL